MKVWFSLGLLVLLNACAHLSREENAVKNTVNFLHDVAPFTSDSLVNVVIEIPAGSNQKWEVNQANGQIEWEQVNPDSFRVINYLPYPANYGFVPQTVLPKTSGGDGDPVDVFVFGPASNRGAIARVRIVGIIHMLDNDESDSKLLAVNMDEPGFDVNSLEMLIRDYPGVMDIIKLWLLHYKGFGGVEILSVNDERDAVDYLKAAHVEYVE
ncbi:inorganic diphosphatase [Geofilum rubicundum]|uniref:inorganic diphosphatase n=1 Tax=Geofilum rubicundum JCM 15548 TaxID=1236989 RepID=A0A0E9LUN1_9BACT|nr:inorganic diphosphatase [Geofilum rubicundum]GAO29297.1 inorganic pyrophosphatase [Geofilum rubicundum JCM 15548]